MLPVFTQFNTQYLCRLKSPLDKFVLIFNVIDYVNIFILQLTNYGVYANSLHSHASAYGIDAFIVRHNSYFGAVSGFTGNFYQFNDTVKNFWDFVFKQPFQKQRRGPRNNN